MHADLFFLQPITNIFILFRPKYIVPSQLLRSVRLINSQFRGYGQQVSQSAISQNFLNMCRFDLLLPKTINSKTSWSVHCYTVKWYHCPADITIQKLGENKLWLTGLTSSSFGKLKQSPPSRKQPCYLILYSQIKLFKNQLKII